jgi:hypothetical protein
MLGFDYVKNFHGTPMIGQSHRYWAEINAIFDSWLKQI